MYVASENDSNYLKGSTNFGQILRHKTVNKQILINSFKFIECVYVDFYMLITSNIIIPNCAISYLYFAKTILNFQPRSYTKRIKKIALSIK